jgi:hypothetical protein
VERGLETERRGDGEAERRDLLHHTPREGLERGESLLNLESGSCRGRAETERRSESAGDAAAPTARCASVG